MAYDLGDPIPLVFKTVDAAGVPANVTTAALTITLPDGSTALPAIGAPSPTGTYQPTTPYISTQVGEHKVRWVGSGTNAQNYTDVFEILPADPGFIISLAEARASLRLPSGQTVDDEDLRSLIASATPVMEDLCGPIIARAHTETYDGGARQLALIYNPVITVTSIIESYGASYVRTLTLQDPFAGTGFDSFGYTIDSVTGIVTRRAAGIAVPFASGTRNIQVVYTAGRALLPANIVRATRRLVRFMWQQEMQGQRPNGSVPDAAASTTPSGYLVPNAVKALCGPELRNPAVG